MASKPNNSRDVFVGNLPDDADEESLSQVFSVIGDVQSVIIKDGKNNMSKFCFVRFYNEDHVETAINEMNGKFFKGKNLSVKPAGRKGNKPDGGGANRQMDQRNFQGQQRRQQGYANRPWGDAGFDKEDFKQWKEESVAVTHIVDATTFYAQICNPDTATAYQNMITQLFHHCSFNPPPATEVNVNQVNWFILSFCVC
ncbi:Cold-inducible RNA-binding protein B [Holothuria leucospilota]|uniref:Cold-inducible RNA-binding protein B n=1 Tax=Holothuria leucospilota TaxID=206669 RepID=A0A9Q0YJC1_HOLLE|nr:Cold-inducible RNA-binding protein B [Holothuria leucospilota]